MLKINSNYWRWYDKLKEPYRFTMCLLMCSPLILAPYMPLLLRGFCIILPFILAAFREISINS